MYGLSTEIGPVIETAPFNMVSPYGPKNTVLESFQSQSWSVTEKSKKQCYYSYSASFPLRHISQFHNKIAHGIF